MNDILFEVLKCVIMVCLLAITRYLIPYLQNKIKESKNDDFINKVIDAVKWAEQTINDKGKGELKKEKVVDFLMQYALDNHLDISLEQLDILIESAVYVLKGNA